MGADVVILDTEPDQHGMTMRRGPRGRVFIAVARTRHPMRQRSTLAHELAHVVFADWSAAPIVDSASPTEIRANVFARHLLIPPAGLADLIDGRAVDLAVLSKVVQWFQVSPKIAAIALEQSGHIDPTTKTRFMSETAPRLATRFGWSDQYQAMQRESDQRRAPQRLLARAIAGWMRNTVSIQTIATLRGLDVASVERELTAAGLTPRTLVPEWSDPDDLPDADLDLHELEDADLGDGGEV
ncbi:ImmA/IrrE family metallo-endopeptidase [Nocardia puris]|nr:ImmA/IrrE family metallo-endopeptidase [Nocardia puris]